MRKRRKNRHKAISGAIAPAVSQFTTANVATDFKIIIPDMVYQKVMWWVNKSNYEVSWFGDVEVDQEKRQFTILNAELAKQKNGTASTDIDDSAMCTKLYEKRGTPHALKWWGHSHVNMGVFWSGTDMETIRELGRQGWIIATVFNKKSERRSAFLQSIDIMGKPHDIFVDQIDTNIQRFLNQEDCDAWDKEYEENVTEDKPVYQNNWESTGGIWHKGQRYSYEEYNKLFSKRDSTEKVIAGIGNMVDSPRYKHLEWPTDWNNIEQMEKFHDSMDNDDDLTTYERSEILSQMGWGLGGDY